ncbi:MAG: DUF4149 domain-containing protein [Candidatus Acidiferrales bacterium]
MTNILRFVQVFALGTWVGSIFYFSAAVAPAAFRVLANQDQAGQLIEFTLRRLHTIGVFAGMIFLFASAGLAMVGEVSGETLVLPKTGKAQLLPVAGVILMLVFTIISQHVVIRRMHQLRAQMVSVASTPPDNPLRAEFDRLHQWSVRLEGSVLLLGFASLFLTVRRPS